MAAVVMCKKMKWTYQEYDNQPEWFLTALMVSETEKAAAQKLLSKK